MTLAAKFRNCSRFPACSYAGVGTGPFHPDWSLLIFPLAPFGDAHHGTRLNTEVLIHWMAEVLWTMQPK